MPQILNCRQFIGITTKRSMPIKFSPNFVITPHIVQSIIRIEAAKERIVHLPLTPSALTSLRETARLYTTHYSTMIEGNRLQPEQIREILHHKGHFPGRERDEGEVQGYYTALTYLEQMLARSEKVSERIIQTMHALVVANGKTKVSPTPYHDGQNIIRDGRTRAIVYMPPEAKDVPSLMTSMVSWINQTTHLACPIVAAIAHYQFATIHPYYDGSRRTARLLTTLLLHKGGYDLKGLYSLEEYYARNLDAYYAAISIGESHNYYLGRAEADITKWIEYFTHGMATSFEKVLEHMAQENSRNILSQNFETEITHPDQSDMLRTLDPRKRKALSLFTTSQIITAKDVCDLFGFKPRTGSSLCKSWVEQGFLEIVNPSNKARTYRLAQAYQKCMP